MLAPKLGVLPPCLRAAVLLGGAALTLLSPVAAGTAQTAEPGQPRRGIPLPARAEPLPPAMQEKVAPLLEAAVRFRGLGLQRPIPLFRLEESELERALEALFAGDLPLVYSQPAERVLEIFGLIPPEMDLRDYSRRLLASQLAAYYEDSFEYIAVVEREGESTLAPLGGGEAVAERLEESLLVHEIAHALQDQHFDIGRFWDHEPFSDRSLAAEALVEGDATLVMLSFLVNLPVERFPPGDGPLDPLMVDAAQFTEMAPELPGDEELRAAPAYLREHLLFPYLQGLAFCLELRRTGGQKLLDHAFRQDPPGLVGADPPCREVAGRARRAGTHRAARPGRDVRWRSEEDGRLLRGAGHAPHPLAASRRGCAGGRGRLGRGRLRPLRGGRPRGARLGNGVGHARRRGGIPLARSLSVPGGLAPGGRGTRVTLAYGLLDDDAATVEEALLAAPAVRSVRPALNLAALGITEADRPAPLGPTEMAAMLKEPAIWQLAGAGPAIAELLQKPQFEKLLERAVERGEFDLGALLAEPEFQDLANQMAKPSSAVASGRLDGGLYTNDDLGFSIRLPPADGWTTLVAPLPAPPDMPPPALVSEFPGSAGIVVFIQTTVLPAPIEDLVPGLEESAPPGFAKLRGEYISTGPHRGYELEGRVAQEDGERRLLFRTYVLGRDLITVVAGAHGPGVEAHQRAISAALDSIAFSEPKPRPPASETGSVPVRIAEGVVRPVKVFGPPPRYTEEAREARVQGAVVLQAVIDTRGDVSDVKVLQGLSEGLDQAAVEAVRQWKFKPATLNGERVAVYYEVAVDFRLEEQASTEPGQESATMEGSRIGSDQEPLAAERAGTEPGEAPIMVGEDVIPPVKLHAPVPQYTEAARKKRIQGVVIVQAIIDKRGDVASVKVHKALPEGLDQAAAEAIRRWKFRPATLNGQPVAVFYNLTINFRLEKRGKAKG